jgi:hypothetical protein
VIRRRSLVAEWRRYRGWGMAGLISDFQNFFLARRQKRRDCESMTERLSTRCNLCL